MSTLLIKNQESTVEARKLILSRMPAIEEVLDAIEDSIWDLDENKGDFYSLDIEEQKTYFTNMAKGLGMDPDDPENELGEIVNLGLKNFDPSGIMRDCENLFVHYRPGGLIAQSLRMYSVGGLHWLICLKHGHAQGTGNLLTLLYDDSSEANLGYCFKQKNCDKCTDCKPRSDDWAWSLKWYEAALEENKDILSKYEF